MQSRKFLIPAAGVILFLLAGTAAMIFQSPKSPLTAEKPANLTASHQSSSKPQEPSQPLQLTPPAPEPVKPEPPAVWYVHLSGAVRKPGVYIVSRDARIFQAVEKAGGLTKNADDAAVNLAEFLADGIHLHIPVKGELLKGLQAQTINPDTVRVPGLQKKAQTPSGRTSQVINAGISSGLVDVNHADALELQRIKGVGPAIAQRIIDYRNLRGAFRSVEDLLNVKGIGAKRLEQIRNQVIIR